MTEFRNFWKNYTNFNDRTTIRGFWMAFLFNAIICAILLTLIAISGGQAFLTGNFDTVIGFLLVLVIVLCLFALAAIVPLVAISIRRLRDSGRPWPWIFVYFVPFVGTIIIIVLLCMPSVPDDGTPVA